MIMAAKAELTVAAIVVNIQDSAKVCEGGTPSFRHVSETGALARDGIQARRSQSARAAPALSLTSAATDRVTIGIADEIHADGLRDDTGDVAVRPPA